MTEIAKELFAVHNGEDCRFELRLWINKIKFNRAQLDTFQRYLEKIVKHFGDIEMMAEVERYQNKFIVYRDVADKLVKDLKSLRNKLADISPKDSSAIESKAIIKEEKEKHIKRSQAFLNIVEELKESFIYFYTSNYISENHIPASKN